MLSSHRAPPALSLGIAVLNSLTQGEQKKNAALNLEHILLKKGRTCADHKQIVLLRFSAKSTNLTQISLFL